MVTSNPAVLLSYQQGNDVAPPPDGYEQITNPLNPLLRSGSRLAHFTDGVYDLSAESHLMRLLKAFLGDAGVGGVQKQMLLIRLQQSMGGTHFFDLDAFYGGIFGVHRSGTERLPSDPTVDLISATDWDKVRIADGSYRARSARFASAIQLGGTARGIEACAEALSGIGFDVVESWMTTIPKVYPWDYWESFTWDQMETYTWDQLERSDTSVNETPRNIITLYPHQQLTFAERFDLERAIDRVKPVNMIVRVDDGPVARTLMEIPFSASSASERWEIRQKVRNSKVDGEIPFTNLVEGEFVEPNVPPWGNYSGEAWTLLDRTLRTLAYSTPGDISANDFNDPTAIDMPPQPFLQRGTVSLPEFALKPLQGLYSGRSVSDGIVNTHGYWDRVGGNKAMSCDGIDAGYIAKHIVSSARSATRFWTTPIRAFDDPANDVLGIRFDEYVTVNHISFDYARFPCWWTIQYWSQESGQWLDIDGIHNRESSPYGIGNEPPPQAVHSFHYGSDHWAKASLDFPSVIAQQWRIVGVHKSGLGPVGTRGTVIPYPLGIRDLDMGFRVKGYSKIPHVAPQDSINTGRNIVGLQTQYYLDRAHAAYVADNEETAWVCEPQAVADAVVNLYLRIESAIPMVINQIVFDPVHSGVVANLYYATAVPLGNPRGIARDDVVVPAAVYGNVHAEKTGEQRGLTLGSGEPAWVDINLFPLGVGSGEMWIGREYILTDVISTAVAPYGAYLDLIAADNGQLGLQHGVMPSTPPGHFTYYIDALMPGVPSVRLAWPTDEIPAIGARLRLFVQYAASGAVLLAQINDGPILDSRNPVNTAIDGVDNTIAAIVISTGIERIGSSSDWDCHARLTIAVNGFGSGPFLSFFDDPGLYCLIPSSGQRPETAGTFLRFHPGYIGWTEGTGIALGFVGGAPDIWEAASWTPIGQFVVTKGEVNFPDVAAIALKLEFTGLIAEPYESFIPVNTTVNRFANKRVEDQGWSQDEVAQAAILLMAPNRFRDLVSGFNLSQDPLVNRVSPTTAIAVIDGISRDRTATHLGFGYNYAQWQLSGRAAIQATAGVHTYVTNEVQSVSRTAFFVGLRSVHLNRNVTREMGDNKVYDDTLLDSSNIDVANTTFDIEPGQLFTPSSVSNSLIVPPRVAVSLPYFSRRAVTAVQFSTQQTGPVQIIPDDEFRDPSLVSSNFSSIDGWHSCGDGIVFWDQATGAVQVSRNPSVLDAFYAPDTPIVHPPVSPVLAGGLLRFVPLDFWSSGGITSPLVALSPQGVVYVGSRVAALNELRSDLWLRVYGSDSTTVLAEQAFRPQVGIPTEVTFPYVITGTPIDIGIQVRVEQDGQFADAWTMYTLSGFDTSIRWEFSVDDGTTWVSATTVRALKNGVVAMPVPGAALRWRATAFRHNCIIDAIRIRPWYLNRLGSEI